MPAGPVLRPWGRLLRFSVRGLVVVVILIGTGMGWLVRSAQIQREAVATIRSAGGSVKYDWARKTGNGMPGGRPRAPRWVADLIGVDYFGHAIDVSIFPSSTTTDAALVQVGRLTRLERLNLDGSSVSDAGLVHLKALAKLSYLSLDGSQVTDAGLARLKKLTNLTHLSLSQTKVGDSGLAHLKGMTKLKFLKLDRTAVSDSGLAHLKGLTALEYVSFGGTAVTEGGVEALKKALPKAHIYR